LTILNPITAQLIRRASNQLLLQRRTRIGTKVVCAVVLIRIPMLPTVLARTLAIKAKKAEFHTAINMFAPTLLGLLL
jgi:hypothetical protein